jgi:CheY-like chemotaxis protein
MTSDPRSTVLVVDDEPNLVALVARMLEPDGYRIMTATSGTEALALDAARTARIDLLLTDLHMPEMSGRGLAVELRKTQLGLKVLYLTAHCDDLFGALTLLEPHEAFMEKPITATGIRDAVSLHLYGTLTTPTLPADSDAAALPSPAQRRYHSGAHERE